MNENAETNEEMWGRYVRRHARTAGHLRVSFNPLAKLDELIVARTEFIESCGRAQLHWALQIPPIPSRANDARGAIAAPQPLLVLVSDLERQWPEFAAFEAQYLTRTARKKHSHLMRVTFISDASIVSRTFKRLQKRWQFDSRFIVNLPRDFVQAQPEPSQLSTGELSARHARPARRFKWRFDLTHPQNYRRWQDACQYRRIAEQRTEKDFRTDLEGTRIRRFARACDEIEAAIAAPMIEHCAAYDGYTPCHGGPFDQRDPKRRRPVVVAHVDFLLREDDFDFVPGTHNVFYRLSNALYEELLNDIARAAYKNNGVAAAPRTPRDPSRPRRWDINGGQLFEWLRNEIDDTDKVRIGKIRATIELHEERPPDHNTPLEVARRMAPCSIAWTVEKTIANLRGNQIFVGFTNYVSAHLIRQG